MLEWVKIGIPFENIHKKYQIFTGIVYFGVMKKFAYRTEDSELCVVDSQFKIKRNRNGSSSCQQTCVKEKSIVTEFLYLKKVLTIYHNIAQHI